MIWYILLTAPFTLIGAWFVGFLLVNRKHIKNLPMSHE